MAAFAGEGEETLREHQGGSLSLSSSGGAPAPQPPSGVCLPGEGEPQPSLPGGGRGGLLNLPLIHPPAPRLSIIKNNRCARPCQRPRGSPCRAKWLLWDGGAGSCWRSRSPRGGSQRLPPPHSGVLGRAQTALEEGCPQTALSSTAGERRAGVV